MMLVMDGDGFLGEDDTLGGTMDEKMSQILKLGYGWRRRDRLMMLDLKRKVVDEEGNLVCLSRMQIIQ